MDEAKKYDIQLIDSWKHAAKTLQAPEQPLHLVTALAHLSIIFPQGRAPVDVSRRPHTLCPSTEAAARQSIRGFAAMHVPSGHHPPPQRTAQTLWLFEHPRQPYESWWSIRRGIFRSLEGGFFKAPVSSGWTLTTVLSSEIASILMRTICSRCSSAIHPRIDRVPVAETFRQPTPFAAMLCNVKDRVQHISVRHAYVAALLWQAMFDSLKLGFGGFHLRGIRSNN